MNEHRSEDFFSKIFELNDVEYCGMELNDGKYQLVDCLICPILKQKLWRSWKVEVAGPTLVGCTCHGAGLRLKTCEGQWLFHGKMGKI